MDNLNYWWSSPILIKVFKRIGLVVFFIFLFNEVACAGEHHPHAVAGAPSSKFLLAKPGLISLLQVPTLLPLPTYWPLSLFSSTRITQDSTRAVASIIPAASMQAKMIPLHYMKVSDLANIVRKGNLGLLSAVGKVTADEHNNTLWIYDYPKRLRQLSKIVNEYDQPMPQIYIKAKIIHIDQDYVRSLGVAFTNSKTVNSEEGGAEGISIPIAKLGQSTLLNATLDALERTGHAHLISAPQLITINRQSAVIEAGEEVPYQESSSTGATSVAFKKAVLSLQVTPEIMPGRSILLHLQINQDQVSSLTVAGVPAINTQAITTQVYMKNQSTIVLGGIFEQTESEQQGRMPGLGRMPIVGSIFRHQSHLSQRKQLLIFVTPVIIS